MQQSPASENRDPLSAEKLVRLDGKEIDVEVTSIPVTYGGKAVVQVVFRDVTERKQIESALVRALVAETAREELSKALAKERELGELKSRFVSMTSMSSARP
jgi:hypothetical protein